MNRIFTSLLTTGIALGVAGATQAQVVGELVHLGGSDYAFQVDNNTGIDWTGFNFGGAPGIGDGGFAGNFQNPIGEGIISVNPSDTPTLGETFFSLPTGLTAVNVVDTQSSLEGAFDSGGDILLAAGQQDVVVAIFTTDGSAPVFLGGAVQNTAGVEDIVLIPEPGSLALLGLGGLALLRRRR